MSLLEALLIATAWEIAFRLLCLEKLSLSPYSVICFILDWGDISGA